MGMYDEVKVAAVFLPDAIKAHTDGWQTKSHEKSLNQLTIEEDGRLFVKNTIDDWTPLGGNGFLRYTGEIRFYQSINGVWWEFVVFLEKGNALKVIQVEPALLEP